jgi:hypothetical protein
MRRESVRPPWDEPALLVKGEPPRRTRYRLLQSWYRECELSLPPGSNGERPVGNMLPEVAVEQNPSLNFLGDERIAAYAAERASLVSQAGGTIDADRLFRNLLSSMPMCFNVFGLLRERPDLAAPVLARATGLDVAQVDSIECEVAPTEGGKPLLSDLTALDAAVEYRTSTGATGLLGVEAKYTEPFSSTDHKSGRYVEVAQAPDSGFAAGAQRAMLDKRVNQLWRDLLLTTAWQQQHDAARAHVVLVSLEDDPGAREAVRLLADHLVEPRSRLIHTTWEQLIEAMSGHGELRERADALRSRYLDLTPVVTASGG